MNPFCTNYSVPAKYIFQLDGTAFEKRFVIAANVTWVRELISTKKIPTTFQLHETLHEDEVYAFLSQGKGLGQNWMFLMMTVLKSTKKVESFRKERDKIQKSRGNMTWPQIVDFIGESNFNYIWEQPVISLLSGENKEEKESLQGESSVYLNRILKTIYVNLEEGKSNERMDVERFPISNLSQAISTYKVSNQNGEDCFYIFQHYYCYNLLDAVTFSPQKLASTSKQMYISYQILQYLIDFQTIDLPVGDLSLKDFKVDECLYINVIPWISSILEQLKEPLSHLNLKGDPEVIDKVKCIVGKVKGWNSINFQIEPKFIEAVIRHWCEGLVSNYDYLMFLNFLCGRSCNGNPNFHPVFPWVSDFSSPMGGWRDLTKSKFRLNKGDRQLDIMYDNTDTTDKTVAHHVTDILSEITYYVYKARRTPKQVLCKFVRQKFVPAEYPGSVQRLQDWTPDECIPEFFDDAGIFKSIHDDLPDLQVPKWCSSPEEFITHHQRMLESDYVSAKLHHWIDTTFGYKLSGSAAVKSKNIYLSLVDSHQHLESHGVVQLFQTAHPPKKSNLRNLRNVVHYKDLKKLREFESEDQIQETCAPIPVGDAKTKVWKNITLPKHYDPTGLLNDFEVTLNFFKTHFPYLKDPKVTISGLKDKTEIQHSVKLFGCLLLEIVLPQKFRHASSSSNVNEKYKFYKEVVKEVMTLVPLFCRRAVQAIFDRESLEFSIPIDISLDLLLLGDKLGAIPFPSYYADMYKMLKTLRNYEKVLAIAAPNDYSYKSKLQELKVQSFSRDLLQLLGVLDSDGIELVLPFVIEMFENPETRILAVWNIFCPFAKALGRKRALEHLLSPIIHIYESDYHSNKHLKLFHKTFLLQLSSCFGLRTFLEQFSTLLIEAIGGWKLNGDQSECIIRTHLTSVELEFDQIEDKSSTSTGMSSSIQRCESEAGECCQEIEPEMFLMEPDVSDSEGNESNRMSTTTFSIGEETTATFPSVFMSEPVSHPGSSQSSRNESPRTLYSRKLSKDTPVGKVRSESSGGGRSSVVDISDVCYESVISLAHRLGPVLTAKYFSKNLLRMLTLCYLDHLDLVESQKRITCDGDIYASKVLDCILAISDLYGDKFIERQYIPYCEDIIKSAKQKLTLESESALIGISAVLDRIFLHIPDTFLMAQLQAPIMKDVLSPLVELICSTTSNFPSGGIPRALLSSKCVSMMNSIRKKIGPDLTQLHLRPVLYVVCKAFQSVYSGDGNLKPEMSSAFDSLLAWHIYSNFCDVIIGSEYESLIRDLYLQQGLSEQSASMRDEASPNFDRSQQKLKMEQKSSFGSRSFGNRIQVLELEQVSDETDNSLQTRKDPTRHLKGNWFVYWDHEIGRSDSKFNFKQIKLQTFTGHSGSVRCIHALDNENSFLTASKDKTVKLFSLRNQGDESMISTCQWTYTHHKKAVLSVLFHEPLHLAASTDGTIHIWDPFVGKLIRMLEKGSSNKNIALRPIMHTSNFVGAGIDSTVHVVDTRTFSAYEMKIGIGQASGLVRCLAVSDNGQIVSVGHSSGMLSTLDLRNGTLLGSWKGHDGEVLQLVPHRNKQLISSSFDQNISVWNLDENRLAYNMRGPTEPVHSMCTFDSELISCSTSNRVGVHVGINSNADFSSTRLRSDTFKGVVTSMRLLPLNQFLLLGSEAGNVVLLC